MKTPEKPKDAAGALPEAGLAAAHGIESDFQTVQFVVEQNFKGVRLDRYLCAKIRRLSRAKAQAIIRDSLDAGRPVKPSTLVSVGMVLRLSRKREPEPETPTELPIIFRDDDLLVFDKPSGLPMHPTARYVRGTLVTLARALAKEGEKPDPAHRLDRETSGLVLCGTRPAMTRLLKLAFARSEVKKAYLAIAEGHPKEDRFEVDLPLGVGGAEVRIRAVIDRVNGKEAKTRFEVLQRLTVRGEPFSLVRCEPVTGRQHQIRIHLSAAGFPIVGDKIYGKDERIFIRFTEKALTDEDRGQLRLPRHALHAAEVAFRHPGDGRAMKIEAPLPKDLTDFLEGRWPDLSALPIEADAAEEGAEPE